MAEKNRQVNVALDDKQYKRWKNEAEENGKYATMSDLVRMSVEKEMSQDDTQNYGKEIAEIQEEIEGLKSAIGGLSTDLNEMKGIVESQLPNNQNIKSEAFAALPEGRHAEPLTSKEVASKIGGPVNTEKIAQVLEELSQQTAQVESIIRSNDADGVVRYKRKGE